MKKLTILILLFMCSCTNHVNNDNIEAARDLCATHGGLSKIYTSKIRYGMSYCVCKDKSHFYRDAIDKHINKR